MTSLDFLYYALGGGFLVLVGFLSYAAYQLALTLKSARVVIDDVEKNILEFEMIKGNVRSGVFGFLANLISPKRGGETNGR